MPGDIVYLLGSTYDELGGSEYFAMVGEHSRGKGYIGNDVPKVDAQVNLCLYRALSKCISKGVIASAQSVHHGGLAVALAKTSMGGLLGMEVSLEDVAGDVSRDDFALYSESQGRVVLTVAPKYRREFERIMTGNAYAEIGKVRRDSSFIVHGSKCSNMIKTDVDSMLESYRSTFRGY
jgi:phosphoribosylformylglycinamidine synthase